MGAVFLEGEVFFSKTSSVGFLMMIFEGAPVDAHQWSEWLVLESQARHRVRSDRQRKGVDKDAWVYE